MRFPSKVDTWIAAILAVAPLVSLGAFGVVLWAGNWSEAWVALTPLVLLVTIYGGLVWPMSYEVGEDAILIRFGLAKVRVRYGDIRAITPTWNPISSPALSLDRLHIDTGNPLGPNISPADKAGFLKAVAAKAPHLRLDGDRLVRA